MTPRLLRRVELLLRRAIDPASVSNERALAVREALRIVSAARAGTTLEAAEWRAFTAMRFFTCEICDQSIRPATHAWRNADDQRHRHNDCHVHALAGDI